MPLLRLPRVRLPWSASAPSSSFSSSSSLRKPAPTPSVAAASTDAALRTGWPAHPVPAAAAGHTPRRRRHPSRLLLALLLLALLAGLALWEIPEWQVAGARAQLAAEGELAPADRLVVEKELLDTENGARATLALILAAGGLLLGLTIAWRRFEASRELRSYERFATAIEQLASERADGTPRTETRLGGIYALERLAAESDREYWPVLEVLTAYVRENAGWKRVRAGFSAYNAASGAAPPRLGADVQAVLAVLGRRRAQPGAERRLLDLRETDLRGANLSGTQLEGVTFQAAHLEQADATRARLARANLREANLTSATLTGTDLAGASLARAVLAGARLNGANLKGADLSGANLQGADLWQANLRGCNLKDADLHGADLTQCDLTEAILWRADLSEAVMNDTVLRGTHLERTNLAGATGLSWEQGEDAYTDENTILPDYLLPEHARAAAQVMQAMQAGESRPVAAERALGPSTTPAPANGNVVQLTSATPRGSGPRRRRQSTPEPAAEGVPKKAALPKHRKPGLVKPA